MRVVGNTSGNRVTQWTVGFRQEKVVSTGEWDGIMQYPGLHMAPQSGVPLEYIKCITFSQRAGWGPSHSIWPPVPLSFSVTKTPSSLHTAPGLASSALTSHSRWGGDIRGLSAWSRLPSPPPALLDWREVSWPSGRESERVSDSESQKSVRSIHSLKSYEAEQRWEKPGP